jgi:phage baseplate assembly protein W
MSFAFPYRYDGRRRTAQAADDELLEDLLEQLLLTAPGERVMRPDFGTGLGRLLFGPASTELAATTEAFVRGAIDREFGDRLVVDRVGVEVMASGLVVSVEYRGADGRAATASATVPGVTL